MLVLPRKTNEVITIQNPEDPDHPFEVQVVEIKGGEVKPGITAPRTTEVHRRETYDLRKKEAAG